MCKFFSLVSNGKGKIYYFDNWIRKKILSRKLSLELDSHTSIAVHFGFKGEEEDKLNKWEYNPLTKKLIADHIGTTNDQTLVQMQLKKLDFGEVVPELVIKTILHPFRDIVPPKKITATHVALLKHWDSVGDPVGDSVRDSVGGSVWGSVGGSVWDSVRDSVWGSVGGSVWDSVRDSVWGSVWGYTGSFFKLPRSAWKHTEKIKTKGYPFQPVVDLWMMGLVPSFDGKTWRLHGGKDAKVLFEITAEELRKVR